MFTQEKINSHTAGKIKDLHILIVDDQRRSRQSLRALLLTIYPFAVIQEAETGAEAIIMVEKRVPDVVFMDIRMPQMNGTEATRHIKNRWPKVKIVALSMYPEALEEALHAGADDYFNKGDPPHIILSALEKVLSNTQESRENQGNIRQ